MPTGLDPALQVEGFSFTFCVFWLRAAIKNVTVEGGRNQRAGMWQQQVNWALPSQGEQEMLPEIRAGVRAAGSS